jgi:uncharacterized membrane protein (UPF0127 family)
MTSPTLSASTVPTPDRGPRVVVLIAAALVVAGVGVMVFALRESSETSPLPAGDITALLAAAQPAGAPFAGLTEVRLALGDDCLRVVVADDETERGQGLRGRTELGPYDGMLFVNVVDTSSAYTMAGVPVALDIGWYARDGAPVDRTEMEPCPEGGPDCPRYSSRGPYRFALETLRGELPTGSLGGCPS